MIRPITDVERVDNLALVAYPVSQHHFGAWPPVVRRCRLTLTIDSDG